MAVEKDELEEEEDTGIYAKMAREVNEAKECPPEECV